MVAELSPIYTDKDGTVRAHPLDTDFIKPHLTNPYENIRIEILYQITLLYDKVEKCSDADSRFVKTCLIKASSDIGLKVLRIFIEYKVTTLAELTQLTGESRQIVNHHLKDMQRLGIIKQLTVRDPQLKRNHRPYMLYGFKDAEPECWTDAVTRFKGILREARVEAFKKDYSELVEEALNHFKGIHPRDIKMNTVINWLRDRNLPPTEIGKVSQLIFNAKSRERYVK